MVFDSSLVIDKKMRLILDLGNKPDVGKQKILSMALISIGMLPVWVCTDAW